MAVLLLLAPLRATPLGLGEIQLHSALNQPLDASVDLVSLGNTPVDAIAVSLAKPEVFEQAGIDRPLFLTRLDFALKQRPDGTPYLKISSSQPVTEPFLDFLVSVDWPSGHLVREYTLLLDPPVLLDEKPSPVEAPSAGGASPAPAQAGSEQDETAGQSDSVAPSTAESAGAPATGALPSHEAGKPGEINSGLVRRTDTLWSIAKELRPDSSVSIEQMMMALLKSNPDAFYDNNVNQLKAGYVLRISDPSIITAMSQADAAAEARRQYEQWLDAKRRQAGAAAPRPEGGDAAAESSAPTPSSAEQSAESGPRLRLVVPDSSESGKALKGQAGATAAGAPDSAQLTQMRSELMTALAEAEAAHQENAELRERLAALEDQIDAMQRLVTLKNDTLTALQAGTTGSPAGTGETEAAGTATAEPQAEDKTGAADAAHRTPAAPAAQAQKPAPAKAAPRQAAQPHAATPTLVERAGELGRGLLNDPKNLGVVGAAALLLLTLAWLMVRRRQVAQAGVEELTAAAPESPVTAAEHPVHTAAAEPEPESAGAGSEPESDVLSASDDSGLDLMEAGEDEIDILAEADVYLAYRRFDKAEELLKDALQREPERQDVMLKLLEVYEAAGNKEAFVRQAETLKAALGDSDATTWSKVSAMGRRLVPEHVLFGGAAAAAAAAAGKETGAEMELAAGEADGFDSLEADLSGLELDPELDQELSQGLDQDLSTMFSGATETTAAESSWLDADNAGEIGAEAGQPGTDSAAGPARPAAEAPADQDLTLDADALLQLEGLGLEQADGDAGGAEPELALDEPQDGSDRAAAGDSDASGLTVMPEAANEAAPGNSEDEPELLFEGQSDTESRQSGRADIDWLSDVGGDLEVGADTALADDDFSNLISGEDEVGTKLDLAKAYIDMGDQESARSILGEVAQEGNEDQQREASELMRQIG